MEKGGKTSGFNLANKQFFVLAPFITTVFAVMNLCQKTQKRVLDRSARPSEDMAFRLFQQIGLVVRFVIP